MSQHHLSILCGLILVSVTLAICIALPKYVDRTNAGEINSNSWPFRWSKSWWFGQVGSRGGKVFSREEQKAILVSCIFLLVIGAGLVGLADRYFFQAMGITSKWIMMAVVTGVIPFSLWLTNILSRLIFADLMAGADSINKAAHEEALRNLRWQKEFRRTWQQKR